MVKIILINKKAVLTDKSVKTFELSTLYKKCGLKSAADFDKKHTWKVGNHFYSVYAKDTGRANSENKYDLPPPVDEALYFNTITIIKHSQAEPTDNTVNDLTKEEWQKTYETLFGGFEDLDNSEEMSEEEDISDSEKTKEGYHKDGFVVDDGEDEDEDYEPIDDEDLEEISSYEEGSDETDEIEYEEGSEEGNGEEGNEEEDSEEEDGEEEDSEEEDSDDDEYYSELSEDSYCSSDED